MVRVLVSGGFDPVHVGHLKLFREAAMLGDELIVLINNDHWVLKKKGYVFMPEDQRADIISEFACVDHAVLTKHHRNPEDMSVCQELRDLAPDVFANGGDRKADNIPEYQVCKELGIDMKFNVGGGKETSSSTIVDEAFQKFLKRCME